MRLSAEAARALSWDRVLVYLADRCRTVLGAAVAPALAPTSEREEREARRDRVVEMIGVRAERGALPLDDVTDPAPFLDRLAVRGARLGGKEIFLVIRLLAVAREVRRALAALDPDVHPRLGSDWSRFPDHDALIHQVEGKVTAAGLLEDHASPELHRLRAQIRTVSERLTKTLEGILDRRHAEKVLRDDFITLRNNRFVLPVRTDAPFPMEGIVHGTSGTGQTLFVEPLETVAINNELVRLKDEEAREEDRILGEWSAWLREARDTIALTGERIAEYDLLQAMARLADDTRSVSASVGEGDLVVLREARHPVLEMTLGAGDGAGGGVVPLTLELGEDDRVLVISGPNTGGKTVALKTVGLLAVMAHAGLPVPAERASFPEVGEVLVDIGDHQSIQASLSTFSSHMSNIASMIRRADAGSLVLLDEVGTGTDPSEGAALAVAVLDRLRRDRARVVATTHHGAVKVWAFNTEGVANAACEFDEESLRPTYRLLAGVAGSSSGLAIAERLGLPPEVVEEARRRLDPREAEAEGYLARLNALAAAREESLRAVDDEQRRLAETRRDLERRSRAEAEERERRFESELLRVLERFETSSRTMLGRIRDTRERKAVERERLRQEARLRSEARQALRERGSTTETRPAPEGWSPAVDESVTVVSLGRRGTVRAMRGEEVEVVLGRTTFRVRVDDLRPAEDSAPAGPTLPAGVSARLGEREAAREIQVIGQRAEEATAAVDKFLDDALLAGLGEVRIVHGHGTGRLRRAVRDLLGSHPHVASFRPGRPEEGGDGATVARLDEP